MSEESADTASDAVVVGELFPRRDGDKPGADYVLAVSRKAVKELTRSSDPALPALYVTNLLLAGAGGIVALVWFAAYTEHLSVLQTALGLGGVFVWIAFLAGVITESRKNALRKAFDAFLSSAMATAVCCLGLVALAVYAGRESAIVFTWSDDDADQRLITVTPLDGVSGTKTEPVTLKKNESVRVTVAARFFPFHTEYLLRATGLPPITRPVQSFWRTMVTVPGSFKERPVVLLRIADAQTATNIQSLARDPDTKELTISVTVTRDNRSLAEQRIPYQGNSVWVGCDTSVPIPQEMRDRWSGDAGEAQALFNQPIPIFKDLILRDGDVISATVSSDKTLAQLAPTPIRGVSYRNISAQLIPIPRS